MSRTKARLFWAALGLWCLIGVYEGVKTVRERDQAKRLQDYRERFERDLEREPQRPVRRNPYENECTTSVEGALRCDPVRTI